MTDKEKLLLKQSIDLMISTVSSQLPKIQDEKDRISGRDMLIELLSLSDKVNEIKIKKDVQIKQKK